MKVKVTNHDQVWKKLRQKLKSMGRENARVKVGVLGDAGTHHSGISMIELAAVHEFGSPAAGIPERSFIRSTFRDNKEELAKVLSRLAKGIITDKLEVDKALGQLGLWGANAVKRRITSTDIPPPLAVATIKRKGSSKPLVDTGQLVGAISWQVGP